MNIKQLGVIFFCSFASAIFAQESQLDEFGLQKFYPTAANTIEWNSAHWANGVARDINWDGDSQDPLGWTDNRSAGNPSTYFKIDGNGILQMLSKGPRFHINSFDNNSAQKQFFKNVEFTAYYKRGAASEGGPNWGGMVVGVRSGNLGHSSSGGNDCDASTYYARFRHDGKWDFEKEWKHPSSYYVSANGIGSQVPLWGTGKPLPSERWIGMKYIVYNIENTVKLELYIDSLTNGEGTNGGKWEKVGEAIDDGLSWSGVGANISKVDGCKDYNGLENAYSAILEGHGAVLMRTDGNSDNAIQAEYKKVTIREIDPNGKFEKEETNPQTPDTPTNPEIPKNPENPQAISRSIYTYKGILPSKIIRFDLKGRPVKENAPKGMYIKQ